MLAEFLIGLKSDAVACRRSAAMEDARFQPCACLSNPIASRGYGRRPIGLQKITRTRFAHIDWIYNPFGKKRTVLAQGLQLKVNFVTKKPGLINFLWFSTEN